MQAEELLQTGRLEESLTALQQAIREDAADPRLRVFLFQTLCVLGQWDRALTQLEVLAGLGSDEMLLARIFQPVVRCEQLRREVFAGANTPMLFGEPQAWMGLLVQASTLVAQGKFSAARELRDQAFDQAPPTAGKINDKPFEWIADADPRLGPMLEAIVEGRYYWIPFCRIKRVFLPPPTDLRDLVWAPAQFIWANGGEASGHVPIRYPGTESNGDNQLRLARKTEWSEPAEGYALGLGQRVLATDAEEFPLLECRTIDVDGNG